MRFVPPPLAAGPTAGGSGGHDDALLGTDDERGDVGRAPRPRWLLALGATVAGGMVVGRLLGYRLGLNTPVHCRAGHLFTTIWIPGVNLKALDLVVARVQYCPVGRHWSLVTPVRESGLTDEDRTVPLTHDRWIP